MMETDKIDTFMEHAIKDCRISRGHMALYLALFHWWTKRGCPPSIRAYAIEIMPNAKISSTATYHRLLRDLHDFGYLKYEPSFYKGKASKISLDN